jgi:hypothetical protein
MSSKRVSRRPFDVEEEEAFYYMYDMVDKFEKEYKVHKVHKEHKELILIISTFTRVLKSHNKSHNNDYFLMKFYGIIADLAADEITIDMAISNIKTFNRKYIKYIESLESRGGRRNQSKHSDVKMKVIKGLCKANNIKLSRVIDGKRVPYNKKELLTKLKRKKII